MKRSLSCPVPWVSYFEVAVCSVGARRQGVLLDSRRFYLYRPLFLLARELDVLYCVGYLLNFVNARKVAVARLLFEQHDYPQPKERLRGLADILRMRLR